MRRNEVRLPAGAGFTLIELLVVLSIIAVLVALSAAAVIRFLGTQQEANTHSFLDRTQGQLGKAVSAVKDDAMKANMSEIIPGSNPQTTVGQYLLTGVCNVNGIPAAAPLAGADTQAQRRARVIYVKLRLRQAFPMDFGEALNPFPLPPLQGYKTYLAQYGITAKVNQPWESAACLLMALQRGPGGGGVDAADIGAGGATKSASLGTVSIPYLADAFGQPLAFSRVPTDNPVLNPNGPQPGANDPMDPEGLLNSTTWTDTGGPSPPATTNCRTLFSTLTQQKLAPASTPVKSYKFVPMIASSGPDKTWQTNPITFAQSAGSDDLFSTP
jgi:prepilin-type N-terminal cleavage/methylation domain-containing protein